MAFTLKIRKTGLFGKKNISLEEIVQNCGFKYGVYNDFYVLDEGQERNGSCILYNPAKIGRGISLVNKGSEVEIRHNIPTTATEIADFAKLVAEIRRQYGKCEIKDDDGKTIPFEAFGDITADLLNFNAEQLVQSAKSCLEQRSWVMTLAMWPLFVDEDMAKELSRPGKVQAFEDYLHEKQKLDAYYAKPRFYLNKVNDSKIASYTLTEECLSIFPTDFNCFIDANNPQEPFTADEGIIYFFIYSEKRNIEGVFRYEKFVEYALAHGATQYDATHILVPEYNKQQMQEIAEYCRI